MDREVTAVYGAPYDLVAAVMQLMSGKHPTWYISSGAHASDKERLAVIKKDTYNGSHSASLFLSNNTTQFFAQPIADYSARGDFGNRSFFIYHGMAPVAEVRSGSKAERRSVFFTNVLKCLPMSS